VVISTYTKALQEQLAKKDIPFLQNTLGQDFRAALCFGGENYLCRRRLNRSLQRGLFETKDETVELEKIVDWAAQTETGLKMELHFEPRSNVWFKICRESDLCRGRKCKEYDNCYYFQARKAQNDAHFLIVNHHLYFADLAAGRQILPEYAGVVFDEAHTMEEVAAAHLGFELTNSQLKYFLDEFDHARYKTGFLHRLPALKDNPELIVLLNAARQAADVFFTKMDEILDDKPSLRLTQKGMMSDILFSTIEQFVEAVEANLRDVEDDEDYEECQLYLLRLKGWGELLAEFIGQRRENHVYWLEVEKKGRFLKYRLFASPIDVAPYLKRLVFTEISPLVLTSATLTVNGSFAYLKERLGIEDVEEEIIPSQFDFTKQALLYAPLQLPDPAYEEKEYVEAISSQVEKLVRITEGRTFVLFTSFKTLDQVYELLEDRLTGFSLLKHRDIPRWQ
jgi:ATP-dependent DNA helicase DinG